MELEDGGCRPKTFRRGDYGRLAALVLCTERKKGEPYTSAPDQDSEQDSERSPIGL